MSKTHKKCICETGKIIKAAVRKGRAHYVCSRCGRDITLDILLIYEATHPVRGKTCKLSRYTQEKREPVQKTHKFKIGQQVTHTGQKVTGATMSVGLCFRCEYRARFYEESYVPRCECGETGSAVSGCYMYKPVIPCITEPQDRHDLRPRFGSALFGRREQFVRMADRKNLACSGVMVNKKKKHAMLYWEPK